MINFNRDELQPDYTKDLENGITHFYSGKWGKADSTFTSLIKQDPKAPEAYFFKAMVPFWKYFFAGQSKIDAKQFLSFSENAIDVSEKYLKANEKDTSIVLLLSGLYGYRALVSADLGEYFTAAKSGLAGFDFTKQILKMDENLAETKIGKGIYYYMSGSVPDNGKWITSLLGMKGTKEDAFIELEVAAQSESRVKVDANLILTYLYLKENKPYQAFQTSLRLTKMYTTNSIFLFLHADSVEKLGKTEDALAYYNQVILQNNNEIEHLTLNAKEKSEELRFNLNQSFGSK